MFIPAPNCALIEVLGSQAGWPCEWTIGARFGSAYSLTNLTALAAAIDGWFNESMLPLQSASTTYEGITVRGLSSEEDLRYDLSEPLPGGNGSDPVPAQVALCATKLTGFTGRSARGRMYIWGLADDSLFDERHITDARQTAYGTAMTALLAAITGEEWEPVVISYFTAGAPRVTASVRIITDLIIRDTRLDTQRRRVGRS